MCRFLKVGAVDFLEQPTIAFVRLAEGCLMPSITEVPIPVRFLFILLGPKTADLDYHEVGRSIATLMSNRHFHNIAYRADDRRELLSAINEFLDDSIVLPPGKSHSAHLSLTRSQTVFTPQANGTVNSFCHSRSLKLKGKQTKQTFPINLLSSTSRRFVNLRHSCKLSHNFLSFPAR